MHRLIPMIVAALACWLIGCPVEVLWFMPVAFLLPTCVCCASGPIPGDQCGVGVCNTHPNTLATLFCTMTTSIGCSFTDMVLTGPAGGSLGSSITGCTNIGWAFGSDDVLMGCCNPSGGGSNSMKVILFHDCGGGTTLIMGAAAFTTTLLSCNPLHVTATGVDSGSGATVNLDFHE